MKPRWGHLQPEEMERDALSHAYVVCGHSSLPEFL